MPAGSRMSGPFALAALWGFRFRINRQSHSAVVVLVTPFAEERAVTQIFTQRGNGICNG